MSSQTQQSKENFCRDGKKTLRTVILLFCFKLWWPEPIYLYVGYVFESRFSAGKI